MDVVLCSQRSSAFTLTREFISFGKAQKKRTKENAFPRHSASAIGRFIVIFGLAFAGCAGKDRPAPAARAFTGARADGSQAAPAHPWLGPKTAGIHARRPTGHQMPCVVDSIREAKRQKTKKPKPKAKSQKPSRWMDRHASANRPHLRGNDGGGGGGGSRCFAPSSGASRHLLPEGEGNRTASHPRLLDSRKMRQRATALDREYFHTQQSKRYNASLALKQSQGKPP